MRSLTKRAIAGAAATAIATTVLAANPAAAAGRGDAVAAAAIGTVFGTVAALAISDIAHARYEHRPHGYAYAPRAYGPRYAPPAYYAPGPRWRHERPWRRHWGWGGPRWHGGWYR